MPLQATSGAASYDAFGGGVPVVPQYIEDVFSTYLYTGTSATRTITNGIDESGKGALTWIKSRTSVQSHILNDTVRGAGNNLLSDSTSASLSINDTLTAFGTTGFTLGADSNAVVNGSGQNYVSWTLREQPKFFDIVTWTGNGTNRTIAHNLGSVPACILVKSTSGGYAWAVYHSSLANTEYLVLNTTAAKATDATYWNSTTPTSTEFSIGTAIPVNNSGANYVAYVFASNAGGFGLTGTDNVISCGSYTGTGSNPNSITLGYEPQWILLKKSSDAANWYIFDNMRGMPVGSADAYLFPNDPQAESNTDAISPTATGFDVVATTGAFNQSGQSYIYIAIRRGPMKVPTSGTSVFQPTAFTSQAGNDTVSSGSVSIVDWGFVKKRTSAELWIAGDRLRGGSYLSFDTTSAEASNVFQWDKQNAFVTNVDDTPSSFIGYSFRRAPSFFDEVVAKGNDADTSNWPHNLGVPPELIIRKSRTNAYGWSVWAGAITGTGAGRGLLSSSAAWASGSNAFLYNGVSTNMTSSYFSTSGGADINSASDSFVTYLFATCAGVSKVGSYTGTATTKQIDCGFTAGARFVLIKRTDSTGDWYVWDSARGIVSGNDSYLLLNSDAAEVTNTDYVDTYSAGFEISSTAPAAINASGGTFIFLAIA